jgi:alcohol dehydrogenase (cytochrome c)
MGISGLACGPAGRLSRESCRAIARCTMRVRRIWMFLAGVAITAFSAAGQGLPVTFERLLKTDQEPGNWLMYSNSYNGWRHSRLTQIHTENVNRLRVQWLFQGRSGEKFETTPLVLDGIMYLTRPENDIFALDAETGRTLWTYSYRNPPRTFNCCGRVNRGLAILGHRLFMNTLDMHVVAVDAKSGRELWKTKMFDYTAAGGYAATGAPLVIKDKVVVGMAGGERGVSGFLDAYDTATGQHVWRFNTIPQPGEANFGTWAGDSWKTGGASTWNNGSYDPELNLVYWGTSNPWPDYNGDFRAGDNLYSCSVVALDADTGKLQWYFQFTPHDLHDWDSTQIPILLDAEFRGRSRKLMLWPNRNGFFYVLDRSNGEFLLAKEFVKQTWARALDDKGRPILNAGQEPTLEGNDKVSPGINGGANWMSHSYSPLTKLLYVFAREDRSVFTKSGPPRLPTTGAVGAPAGGGAAAARLFRRARFAPEENRGKVIGLDPGTGEIRWEHWVVSPPWGGVMSTAGNLVFGGTLEGNVFALDARTGKPLWRFLGNDRVYSSPTSYLTANGKQYVSLPVGDVLLTFGLD